MNNTFSIDIIIGGFDNLFKTLLIFIIIDYITGILKSIYLKKINSKIGAKGIIKKIGYILLIIITSLLDNILNANNNIRNIITYMFITNEGISIIENWSSMGIKIPSTIKNKFKSLNDILNNKNKS